MTIGLDLGNKASRYCEVGDNGERLSEGRVATTRNAMTQTFSGMGRCRIAMEVGTHSPWLSRMLTGLGFEVIVANARQVQDRRDAHLLARLARVDPQLLRPIRHRSEQAQADLMTIRIRAALVEARTGLVNAARGFAKAMGERLPACDTDALGVEKLEALPAALQPRLQPLLEQIEVDGPDPEVGRPTRADRPDRVSGNPTPHPSAWGRDPDRSDVFC
jgi:transposase